MHPFCFVMQALFPIVGKQKAFSFASCCLQSTYVGQVSQIHRLKNSSFFQPLSVLVSIAMVSYHQSKEPQQHTKHEMNGSQNDGEKRKEPMIFENVLLIIEHRDPKGSGDQQRTDRCNSQPNRCGHIQQHCYSTITCPCIDEWMLQV